MFTFINKITRAASSKRGAKWTVIIWIILMIGLSGASSGAKEYATSINHAGLKDDTPSMIAQDKLAEHFEGDLGVPAILVFHNEKGLTDSNMEVIDHINKKIDEASFEGVQETILVYEFSEDIKQTFVSENGTTFILPVKLDRKSTRLNSSHVSISYAVFCLKKKIKT